LGHQQRIGLRILAVRFFEQIVVLQLRVEPVVEHLDRPVQRDVLGNDKLSHVRLQCDFTGIDTVAASQSSLA